MMMRRGNQDEVCHSWSLDEAVGVIFLDFFPCRQRSPRGPFLSKKNLVTPEVVKLQGTPVWRRRVADQSITVVCIPVPTLLYQLYLVLAVPNIPVQTELILTVLVVIAPLFGLALTSNCSWLYIQDPNEVSARQKWLVLGNSSALALPIISRVRTGYIASLSPMQDRSKEKKLSAHESRFL